MLLFILSLLFVSPGLLLPLGRGPRTEEALKVVELEDTAYRTLGVVPFVNNTGSDYYAYVGRTVQKFLYENLRLLDETVVTTNDFFIPPEMRTNRNTVFSYPTNRRRKIVLLKPDQVYRKYLSFSRADSVPLLAEHLASDYLVHGRYKKTPDDPERFSVEYRIYNRIRRTNVFSAARVLESRRLEEGIREMAGVLAEHLSSRKTGFLRVVSAYSNYELLIDGILVDHRRIFQELPAGPHALRFRFMDRIVDGKTGIQSRRTNFFYLTNRFEPKAVLRVVSDPAGAAARLNVRSLGLTPLVETNLEPGPYRLSVARTNYKARHRNVTLRGMTNAFFFKLEEIPSRADLEKANVRHRRIMLITLGTGVTSLIGAYYFLSRSDDEYDRYIVTGNREYYERTNRYLTAAFVSGLAGLGSLTVSFIYFLKVLSYDDLDIGRGPESPEPGASFAFQGRNGYLLFQKRF